MNEIVQRTLLRLRVLGRYLVLRRQLADIRRVVTTPARQWDRLKPSKQKEALAKTLFLTSTRVPRGLIDPTSIDPLELASPRPGFSMVVRQPRTGPGAMSCSGAFRRCASPSSRTSATPRRTGRTRSRC